MNEEREMIIRKRGLSPSVQRRAAFQEVPGESEADAVRDAFLQAAGTQPASAASVLGFSDDSTRARAVTRMQEERGNGFVQRVVAEERGTPGRLMGLSQDEMVGEVQQRKGSGSTLPEAARQPLEQHMGADLTKVRVHTDSEAVSLSRELEASAFTVGSDIFFAEGQYDPSSSSGLGLLAHEIAHVGQQGGLGNTAQRQVNPEEEEEGVQRQAAPEEEEEAQP